MIFHSNILPNSYFRFAFAQAIHETCQLSSTKLNISILIFKQNLRNSRLATAIYYLLQLSFCVRTGRHALIGYWKRHWPISWKWSVFPGAGALVFPASCRQGMPAAGAGVWRRQSWEPITWWLRILPSILRCQSLRLNREKRTVLPACRCRSPPPACRPISPTAHARLARLG